ncbi:LysM peptidoglycan-binding domain-containing protein [Lentilactobacillus farraginis]|uniref:LysM domain-containing protein n=1 Tax=Lentilactobacillus farraginis DSM 18382 = JCM 14108 TaxID=1423743 RepID=X0PF30_9LACO|nr:LysM domain-containing protein [Lentilactobacillus farraginis]GAF35397.1 hypothetical protein JCM14108_281 [Lentilactobacillus farraginis DSM 18382 = JCM 14108]
MTPSSTSERGKKTSTGSQRSKAAAATTTAGPSKRSSTATGTSSRQPNTTNPTSSSGGHRYATVQAGQGIYRVAVNNGLTMAQLMEMNGLSSDSQIHPGQKLRVK